MAKNRSEISNISPYMRQCFVTAGIVINTGSVGSVIGFSAILLPQLRLPESYIKIDASSASWIASIVAIALLIGNCITPYIMEKFGRRLAHLSNTIPMIIGWFIIIYSQSVSGIIFGRLLQGIAMGVQVSIASVIIGEYSSPRNRGFFLSMIALALSAGILVSHTLGIFLTWQWTALGCIMFPITAFLISICSPETPSWLVSKNRFEEARESFYWLRGRDNLLDLDELEVLINVQILENKLKESAKLNDEEDEAIMTALRKPELYKPILIMFHLYIMYQFAGTNVLASYTIDILKAMVGEDANVYIIMFLIDVIRLATAIAACTVMKKFKRRKVMFFSGTLVLITLLSMSGYVFLKRSNYFDVTAAWIPTTLLALYTVALFIGLSQVPFALAGEIFPIAYRNMGAGISGVALSSMLFAAVKTAPPLFAAIGIDGTFVMYSGIVLYVLVYLYFILPETKDKTLQEIENGFKGVDETTNNRLDLSNFKSLQSLHSIKQYHNARRFSAPICI